MILKSFQILAICTSMAVTPSNFHYEQPKRTYEENDFTLNVQYNQHYETSHVYSNLGFGSQYRKEYGNNYNTAMAVYCNRYIQTARNLDSQNQMTNEIILPRENYINTFNQTSIMYAMQITPYKNLKNTNAHTVIDIRLNNTIYLDPDTNENLLSIQYKLISSTDSYWSKYINASNYAVLGFNNEIYTDLTNPEIGFIYNETTQIKDFTTNMYQQVTYETLQVEIPSDVTSYVYIYAIPYIRTTGGTDTVTVTGNSNWTLAFGQRNLVVFTGTEILSNVTTEVIDLPGVMFDILTMPFTFISIAFNLTLFAGTPYQINISNLFLSIIAMLVFIFIIRKILQR